MESMFYSSLLQLSRSVHAVSHEKNDCKSSIAFLFPQAEKKNGAKVDWSFKTGCLNQIMLRTAFTSHRPDAESSRLTDAVSSRRSSQCSKLVAACPNRCSLLPSSLLLLLLWQLLKPIPRCLTCSQRQMAAGLRIFQYIKQNMWSTSGLQVEVLILWVSVKNHVYFPIAGDSGTNIWRSCQQSSHTLTLITKYLSIDKWDLVAPLHIQWSAKSTFQRLYTINVHPYSATLVMDL